jgi:hypothetical protein
MAKKKINIDLEDDDELIEEISDEITDNLDEVVKEEDNQEPDSPIDLGDDDEVHDDIIEIDDEDLNFDKPEETQDDVVLSKHTLQGKHSLKYDSIFKGKKEDPLTEDSTDTNSGSNENFEVDKSSHYWFESVDNENYVRQKRIKEKVYEVLSQHTDLNFLNNRRKPSRVDFNQYYYLLITNLHHESFTNVELFNELAVYFSDNLFNMFKLLDNKWRNLIITELQDHIGKQSYSNEVRNRNIYIGTEIEFLGEDPSMISVDLIHITGVVVEANYETSVFIVNSYEKIYEVEIENVTKILNNTKFKYNLNRLNNIDFL